MKYRLLAIDLQNEFAIEGGGDYRPRPSVNFLNQTLFPFLKERKIKIAEIISDYRQPRPGDRGVGCTPGTWGYESIVPREIVDAQWVKCMNSPLWVRENIGNPSKAPGLPYQDPEKFGAWLKKNIGDYENVTPVLFGLTIDCCVLSTTQELNWHGYRPLVLKEGVDTYSGDPIEKENIFKSPLPNWGNVIIWDELTKKL